MIYFRSILFYLGQGLSTIPFALISLLAMALPAKLRSRIIAGWAIFVTWWLRITCGLKYDLINPENILDEPCVYASNHSSVWETITTQKFLPALAWVLKKELLKIPFFGWGLWITQPIAIDRNDRTNALEQVIRQGKEKFLEGRNVLIFPEGTRTKYGVVGNYKKGAAKLARAGKVSIVPIAHVAGKYWSKDSPWIKSGTIKCIIGPVIHTENKTDQEITDEIKNWVISQNL